MPSPLTQAGAQMDKPEKRAPLHINRFFTGLWTNRGPLREAGVPYLYEKFYSGARFDSVWAGSNMELTTRLTWARRPGLSVYNSQTFPAIDEFYPFRVTDPLSGVETIRLIADSAATVYDATGPSTQTTLYTKAASAGQTSFQSVGNTLYAGDGAEVWKWVWAPAWQPTTRYQTGFTILDPNNNLQQLTGVQINFPGNTIFGTILTNNVCQLVWGNTSAQWSAEQLTDLPGETITLSGFTTLSFLNGQQAIVSSVLNRTPPLSQQALMFFPFVHTPVGYGGDTGTATVTTGQGTSGNVTPTWSTTIGATTSDGVLTWTCKGPSVENWGILGPLNPPTVANVLQTAGTAWAANTYYWPAPVIVDSNGNLQLLTTAGTTAGAPPVWSSTPGVTTADGSAVWTCEGSATRATTTAYAINSYIGVTVTTTQKKLLYYKNGLPIYTFQTFTNYFLFQCTIAGTSSGTSTANISWPQTLGGTVVDGTVTWANVGYQVTRTSSANSSPSYNTQGNVTNTTLVATNSSIIDASGFQQNVTLAGKSGGSAPTWATSSSVEKPGLVTIDNGINWTNAGPVTAANTSYWVYTFSYKNSVTKQESTAAPISSQIVLQGGNAISVSGAGDPNYATDGVDTINIYRSVQGSSVPFFLTSIPAPLLGAPWSYIDSTPDPPAPAAILNNLISPDLVGTNAPPPSNLIGLTYHLGRMWGIANEFVQYSQVQGEEVGVGPESWSAGNYFQMPSTPVVLWPSAAGIFFFTNADIWLSSGIDGNGNPLTPTLYLGHTGILSPNNFTVNGSVPALLASDNTFQILDPASGVQWAGLPIADKLAAFTVSSSYVTWHSFGTDSAYYVSDGATGWYRLSPLSPPESGFAWSTFATIVGGCKCVQSVETSPGVRQLLIGPTSSGQILTRDLTTNQDNGSNYAANLTIGSIILAQPNQCAEIVSITTECPALGSHPTVGILGDEISGAFSTLTSNVNDPPYLLTSSTIYADRWYFDTMSNPAWMRNLMIQLSWPAENFQNELYTYSLFGSVHSE